MCFGAPKVEQPQQPALPRKPPSRVDPAARVAKDRASTQEMLRRGLLSTYRQRAGTLQQPAQIAGKSLYGE